MLLLQHESHVFTCSLQVGQLQPVPLHQLLQRLHCLDEGAGCTVRTSCFGADERLRLPGTIEVAVVRLLRIPHAEAFGS